MQRRLGFTSVELNVDSSVVVRILLSMEDLSPTSRSLVQKMLLQMDLRGESLKLLSCG